VESKDADKESKEQTAIIGEKTTTASVGVHHRFFWCWIACYSVVAILRGWSFNEEEVGVRRLAISWALPAV
jgi:hypothetical protein